MGCKIGPRIFPLAVVHDLLDPRFARCPFAASFFVEGSPAKIDYPAEGPTMLQTKYPYLEDCPCLPEKSWPPYWRAEDQCSRLIPFASDLQEAA